MTLRDERLLLALIGQVESFEAVEHVDGGLVRSLPGFLFLVIDKTLRLRFPQVCWSLECDIDGLVLNIGMSLPINDYLVSKLHLFFRLGIQDENFVPILRAIVVLEAMKTSGVLCDSEKLVTPGVHAVP